MSEATAVLCAITSLGCTVLLVRGYVRSRSRLLLYTAICFVGLLLNNLLLVVDTAFRTDVDLATLRLVPAVIGLGALALGLALEGE